tara:strand:- start:24105 stop:41219 length:17115 start_codon:yes stop_codon:yes gene_type:complete
MADIEDPFEDAPIQNPYGDSDGLSQLRAGVARHQRRLDALNREQEQRKEQKEREQRARDAEIERIQNERIARQNKITRGRASDEGLDDYLLEDKDGRLRMSLTDDQVADHRKTLREIEKDKAKREAAKSKIKGLSDQIAAIRKDPDRAPLTPAKRRAAEEDLEKDLNYLEGLRQRAADGEEGAAEFLAQKQQSIAEQRAALDADDESISSIEEINQRIKRQERIGEGFPEDLARTRDGILGLRTWDAPTTEQEGPEEVSKFIDAYNREVERNNEKIKSVQEDEKKAADSYHQKIEELETGFLDWVGTGVTPDQIKDGRVVLRQQWAEITKDYLRERYEYDKGIKAAHQRGESLDLLRPIIGDAIEDYDGFGRARAKEAAEAAAKARKQIVASMREQQKEFNRIGFKGKRAMGPSYGKEVNDAYDEWVKTFEKGIKAIPDDIEYGVKGSWGISGDEGVPGDDYVTGKKLTNTPENKKEYLAQKLAEIQNRINEGVQQRFERSGDLYGDLVSAIFQSSGNSPALLKALGKHGYDVTPEFAEDVEFLMPLYVRPSSADNIGKAPFWVQPMNVAAAGADFLGGVLKWGSVGLKAAKPGKQYGTQPGHQNRINRLIDNLREAGYTGEEIGEAFDNIQLTFKKWPKKVGEEPSRFRSDGSIMLHPELNINNKKAYAEAVRSAEAPEFIKNHYLSDETYQRLLTTYLSGVDHAAQAAYSITPEIFGGTPTPAEFKRKFSRPALATRKAIDDRKEELRELSATINEKEYRGGDASALRKSREDLETEIEGLEEVHAKELREIPSYNEQMAEYVATYSDKIDGFGATIGRPARMLMMGGGKAWQTLTGIGAVLAIPGAKDLTINAHHALAEQREGAEYLGTAFDHLGPLKWLSKGSDILLEEGPSLLFSLIPGVGASATATSKVMVKGIERSVSRQVTRGVLSKAAAKKQKDKFLQDAAKKWGLRGSAAGAGFQSAGLSWSHYYEEAKSKREAELGRALTAEEEDDLASSQAVAGRAMVTGVLTATVVRAFGSTGVEKVFARGKVNEWTVRDFWRSIGAEGTKRKEKFISSFKEVVKASAFEGAEEFTDQFLSALAFDDASFSEIMGTAAYAGAAGLVLGGFMGATMSAGRTGMTVENFADPKTARAALGDVFGKTEYTQEEVEAGLELVNYNPGKGSNDGGVAARNLQVAIEAHKNLNNREESAFGSRNYYNRLGNEELVAEAQAEIDSVNQVRGLIKIASGKVNDDSELTAAEFRAVNQAANEQGNPAIREVNGQLVITKDGIKAVQRMDPDAGEFLIALNEEARLKQIRETPLPEAEETVKAEARAEEKPEPTEKAEAKPEAKPAETEPEAAKPDVSKIKGAAVEGGRQVIRNSKGEHYSKRASAQIRLKKLIKDGKLPSEGFSVVEEEAGKWIIAEDVKGEEAAPSGGKKKWRVTINVGKGKTRTVEVEAETKAEAEDAAIGEIKAPETIFAVEELGRDAPTLQTEPKKTKKAPPAKTLKESRDVASALQGSGLVERVITETEETPVPKGRDYVITKDGDVILSSKVDEMSDQKQRRVAAKILVELATSKVLTDEEAKALFGFLPKKAQELIAKRAEKVKGEKVSDADALRYFVENQLLDPLMVATMRQVVKQTGRRKSDRAAVKNGPLGLFLKYLRRFLDRIKTIIADNPALKKELQFYERMAMALITEQTSDRVLADLGVAIPESRITDRKDVVLPPNIRRLRGGQYEVTLPGGRTQIFATRAEAREKNAHKYEDTFHEAAKTAEAMQVVKGRLSIEELNSQLRILKDLVATVSTRTGYSKETIYSFTNVLKVGGEFTSLADALAEASRTGKADKQLALQDAIRSYLGKLSNINEDLSSVLENATFTERARRALAASRMVTSVTADVADGNPAVIPTLRRARDRFLALVGKGTSEKGLQKLQQLVSRKEQITEQIAAIATEDLALGWEGGVDPKAAKLKKELADVDKKIEKVTRDQDAKYAKADVKYRKHLKRKIGATKHRVKGLAEVDPAASRVYVGISDTGDVTTLLHEFIHVLQHVKDPDSGKSLLDTTIGVKNAEAMAKWAEEVNPATPLETMAEGLEAFLQEGKSPNPELQGAFSELAPAIYAIYKDVTKTGGYRLTEEARAAFGELFADNEVVGNSLGANAVRTAQLHKALLNGAIAVDEKDLVLALPNGRPQAGFKKRKAAEKLVESLYRPLYGDSAKVIEHEGKFYAGIDLGSEWSALKEKLSSSLLFQKKAVVSKPNAGNDRFRVGSALPTGKNAPKRRDVKSNISGAMVSEELLAKHMKAFNYDHLPKSILNEKNPYRKRELAIEWMVENLLAIHDALPARVRAEATRWYDGASKLANTFARRYGYTKVQTAGVIAVLSPQNNWFKNVDQAEKLIDIYTNHKNEVISYETHGESMERIIAGAQASQTKKRSRKDGETPSQREVRLAYNRRQDEMVREERRMQLEALEGLTIRKLKKLGKSHQAWAIRLLADHHWGNEYNVRNPDGDIIDVQRKKPTAKQLKRGEEGDPSTHSWGSTREILNAVAILDNGSLESLNKALGTYHKVRNFYNNIVAPNSPMGDVTMDTHAIAAAHLMPYGGKALPVKQNFGEAIANSNEGVNGTYHLYVDAYREAARRRGLMPRQMQSIVWEGIRVIHPTTEKTGERGKKRLALTKNSWKNNGNARARQIIINRSGPLYPDWFTGRRDRGPKGVSKGLGKDRKKPVTGAGRTTGTGVTSRRGRKSSPTFQLAPGQKNVGTRIFEKGPSEEAKGEGIKGLGLQGQEAYAFLESLYRTDEAFNEILSAAAKRGLTSLKSNAGAYGAEQILVREWAEENNFINDNVSWWQAHKEFYKNDPKAPQGGYEHKILLRGGYVEKIYAPTVREDSILEYLNSLIWHNYLFPETSYELLGFMNFEDRIVPHVRQKLIVEDEKWAKEHDELSKINPDYNRLQDDDSGDVRRQGLLVNEMIERGLIPIQEFLFYDPAEDIVVGDLHKRNFFIENGEVKPVDAIIVHYDRSPISERNRVRDVDLHEFLERQNAPSDVINHPIVKSREEHLADQEDRRKREDTSDIHRFMAANMIITPGGHIELPGDLINTADLKKAGIAGKRKAEPPLMQKDPRRVVDDEWLGLAEEAGYPEYKDGERKPTTTETSQARQKLSLLTKKLADLSGLHLSPMFHGTKKRFTVFNISSAPIVLQDAEGYTDEATPISDWGNGIYTTNTRDDATLNYAKKGADWDIKVQDRAKAILKNPTKEQQKAIEAQSSLPKELVAMMLADKEASESIEGSFVKDLYVKLENPAEFGPDSMGNHVHFEEWNGERSHPVLDALEVIKENIQAEEGATVVTDMENMQNLQELLLDGPRYEQVEKALKVLPPLKVMRVDRMGGFESLDSNSPEIARRVFEVLGHDGIIDRNILKKFPMKGVDESTIHVIAFRPTQVKSSDTVTYHPETGRIVPPSERFDMQHPDILLQQDPEVIRLAKPDAWKRNRVSEAIREIEQVEGWDRNPLHPAQIVTDTGVSIEVFISPSDNLHWASLISFGQRRKGNATAVIEKLKEIADKHNVLIEGFAKPFDVSKNRTGTGTEEQLSLPQLLKFYESRGFTVRSNGDIVYHKDPAVVASFTGWGRNADPQNAAEVIVELKNASEGLDLSSFETGRFGEFFEEEHPAMDWQIAIPEELLVEDYSVPHILALSDYFQALEAAFYEYIEEDSVDPSFEDYIEERIGLLRDLLDFLEATPSIRPPTFQLGPEATPRGANDADADKPSDMTPLDQIPIPGMDKRRGLRLQSSNMYGRTALKTLAKELFQNGLDAVMKKKAAMDASLPQRFKEQVVLPELKEAGIDPEGELGKKTIQFHLDNISTRALADLPKNLVYRPSIYFRGGGASPNPAVPMRREDGEYYEGKVASFADNGIGMSPELVLNTFLVPYVSGKKVGEGGGFGIAKLVFLMGPNNVWITTVTENEEGQKIRTRVEIGPGAYERYALQDPDDKGVKKSFSQSDLVPGGRIELVSPGENGTPGMKVSVDLVPEDTETGTAYVIGLLDPSLKEGKEWDNAALADQFLELAAQHMPDVTVNTDSGHGVSQVFVRSGTQSVRPLNIINTEEIKDFFSDFDLEGFDVLIEAYNEESAAANQEQQTGLSGNPLPEKRPITDAAGIVRYDNYGFPQRDARENFKKSKSWRLVEGGVLETAEARIELLALEGDKLSEKSAVTAYILNRGILQFKEVIAIPAWGSKAMLPVSGIAVNIQSKVKAGETGYPFTLDRNNMSEGVEERIGEFLKNLGEEHHSKMISTWKARRDASVPIKRVFEDTPERKADEWHFAQVAADKPYEDRKEGERKIPESFAFLDLSATQPESLVQEFVEDPVIQDLAETYYQIQGRVLHYLKEKHSSNDDFGRAGFTGFAIGTNAYGLHLETRMLVPEDQRDLIQFSPSAIYHDPVATFNKVLGDFSYDDLLMLAGDNPADVNLVRLQRFFDEVASIALHEGMHQNIKSEGEELARALTFDAGGLIRALEGSLDIKVILGEQNEVALREKADKISKQLKLYHERFGENLDETEAEAFITGVGSSGYGIRIKKPEANRSRGNRARKPDVTAETKDALSQEERRRGLTPPTMQKAPKDAQEGAERAKRRMDKRGKTLRERLSLFRKRDARNAAGEKVVKGDPSRAKVGDTAEVRNAYDVSQEIYEETFIAQNFPQWKVGASAERKSQGDDEIRRKVFESSEKLGQPGTPEFQIASMQVLADDFQKALTSGNQAEIDNVMAFAHALQELRGEIARTMTSMRDPFQTPAQRAAYALGMAMNTVPPGQMQALRKKHGAKKSGDSIPAANKPAFDADLKKLQRNRLEQSKRVLKRDGMSVEEIFNSSNDGVAIGTTTDQAALGELTPKFRKVVQMAREGADTEAIEAATGVSKIGQRKAMEKFRTVLEPKVRELVKRGYNENNMGSFASGTPLSGKAKPGTDQDVNKVLDRSFKASVKALNQKGFNVNNPIHVQAAFRALDNIDIDYVTRTFGSWYGNVFSAKTVLVNLMSIPFAGYRMIGEQAAESLLNKLAKHPEAAKMGEFKYIARGMKTYLGMAIYQGFLAYDTETAYFNSFVKGGVEGGDYRGETHEEVRGYQMGHLLDYVDQAIEKMFGKQGERPAMIRRALGEKGAKRKISLGGFGRNILRFNMGVDEFMRFIVAGSHVGGIAYRVGTGKGLEGAELERFIHREMTVPGSSSWTLAAEEANVSVFTKDLPSDLTGGRASVGDAVAYVINKLDQTVKNAEKSLRASKEVSKVTESGLIRISEVAWLDSLRIALGMTRITVIPFARVLANLVREGYARIPNPLSVGYHSFKLSQYLAKNRGNPDPKAAESIRKLSQQLLSTVLAAAILAMFEGDEDDEEKPILITGSMPKFGKGAAAEREAAIRAGMGPFKIRIKKDATLLFGAIPVGEMLTPEGEAGVTFDYGRIDPLAITLGTTIDWVKTFKRLGRKERNIAEAGWELFTDTLFGQLTDKTSLRGMNDAFGIASGKISPEKWSARQFATFLVPNVFRQPIRDGNLTYDARLSLGDANPVWKLLLYEMYPSMDSKVLGIDLPRNKFAPGSQRDAYGELLKRPRGFGSWIARQQPYTPKFFDKMIHKGRKLEPYREDLTMPTRVSNSYVYTDEATGLKQKHKMTPLQYKILQQNYQRVWQEESLSVRNAEDIAPARRRASDKARAMSYENIEFKLEARRTFNKKLKDKR